MGSLYRSRMTFFWQCNINVSEICISGNSASIPLALCGPMRHSIRPINMVASIDPIAKRDLLSVSFSCQEKDMALLKFIHEYQNYWEQFWGGVSFVSDTSLTIIPRKRTVATEFHTCSLSFRTYVVFLSHTQNLYPSQHFPCVLHLSWDGFSTATCHAM